MGKPTSEVIRAQLRPHKEIDYFGGKNLEEEDFVEKDENCSSEEDCDNDSFLESNKDEAAESEQAT